MEPKQNNVGYWVGGLIVLVLLGALGYYALNRQNDEQTSSTQSNETSQTATENSANTTTTQFQPVAPDEALTIFFSDDGFDSGSYAVQKGQTVTVKNTSSMTLEFASDNHPTHLLQPELNTQPIGPGKSTTFTPTKVGTWGFHDHLQSQYMGELVVTD